MVPFNSREAQTEEARVSLADLHWLTICVMYLVPAVPSMTSRLAHVLLVSACQAYKGVKAIVSAALLSHIDPHTNTNPFYEGMCFLPGNTLSDAAVGPQHATAAELEEVIASAAAHLPDLLANKGAAGAQVCQQICTQIMNTRIQYMTM